MADDFSDRNRIRKIETGTSPNTWGVKLNEDALELIDTALDGWTTKALSGNVTLTSSNGAADEARSRVLKFTGTGAFQVTTPSVEKMYLIDNQCTGNLTITTGSGTTAVLATADVGVVICDGTNVKAGTVLKSYVDGLVLPSQTGNSGKSLTTNGTAASWATVPTGVQTALDLKANKAPSSRTISSTTPVLTADLGGHIFSNTAGITLQVDTPANLAAAIGDTIQVQVYTGNLGIAPLTGCTLVNVLGNADVTFGSSITIAGRNAVVIRAMSTTAWTVAAGR